MRCCVQSTPMKKKKKVVPVTLLLFVIIPRGSWNFCSVVRVNGNRSCAKSRIASDERCSRLTRGNDPEDRNALSARARLRSGVLPVVMPKKHRSFRSRRTLSRSGVEDRRRRRRWGYTGDKWNVLLQKSRRKADGRVRHSLLTPVITFARSDWCVYYKMTKGES